MDVETRSRQVSPGVVGWMMGATLGRRDRSVRVQPITLDPADRVRPPESGRDSDVGTGRRCGHGTAHGLGRDIDFVPLFFRHTAISSHCYFITPRRPTTSLVGKRSPAGTKFGSLPVVGILFSIGGKDPRQTESGRLTRHRDRRTRRRDIGTGLDQPSPRGCRLGFNYHESHTCPLKSRARKNG